MVYDWTGRYQDCYRMYVDEGKTQDEILDIFKRQGFVPSKRAFQNQLKKWDFPKKRTPTSTDAELVGAVQKLWESNIVPKEMIRVLNEQGFDIKDRELGKIRTKHGWFFRAPNAAKPDMMTALVASGSNHDGIMDISHLDDTPGPSPDEVLTDDEADHDHMLDHESLRRESDHLDDVLARHPPDSHLMPSPLTHQLHYGHPSNVAPRPVFPTPSPTELAARALQREKIRAESAARLANRTRRRHLHARSGLPADPPQPPRFPSETTLEESKAILGLSKTAYQSVRSNFANICSFHDIIKKKEAGQEKWQRAKEALIASSAELHDAFRPPNSTDLDKKAIALDVVCMDVTKTLRTKSSRMTIFSAKTTLGLPPPHITAIRDALTARLAADQFQSKTEAGEAHWKGLREAWMTETDVLVDCLNACQTEEERALKEKACDVICGDVMKRFRDDRTRVDHKGPLGEEMLGQHGIVAPTVPKKRRAGGAGKKAAGAASPSSSSLPAPASTRRRTAAKALPLTINPLPVAGLPPGSGPLHAEQHHHHGPGGDTLSHGGGMHLHHHHLGPSGMAGGGGGAGGAGGNGGGGMGTGNGNGGGMVEPHHHLQHGGHHAEHYGGYAGGGCVSGGWGWGGFWTGGVWAVCGLFAD